MNSQREMDPGDSPDSCPECSLPNEGTTTMMHFSCDLCGKDMTPANAQRYVVKMEAFAAHDPAQITEEDLDIDHVEEMAEMLTEMEDAGTEAELEVLPARQSLRFDLCPTCYGKFLSDPLGRETVAKFDFSEN